MRLCATAFAFLLAFPARAQEVDRWSGHIAEASRRFSVPEDWIRRVIQAESGGRTAIAGRPTTSRAGAVGLMQLMPATWAEMRAKHGLGPDAHHPRDNILAGTAYLRAMYDRFGYPGLFAAYNAGPARYCEHLASGRRLPAETIAYVAQIRSSTRRDAAAFPKEPTPAGLFVSLLNSPASSIRARPSAPAPDPLFIRLSTAAAASE